MTQMDTQKEAMVQALERSLGIVTTACRAVGISRQTHYNWMKSDVEYRERCDELENVALDFAESQLHAQIKSGVPSSTIFYLKTKGKGRGYIDKQQIEIEGAKPATWFDDDKLE